MLNAPWGVTRASDGCGQFCGDIRIGNFGDQGNLAGWINVFDRDGETLGALRDGKDKPISIDDLWSLVFGTILNCDADTL